MQRTIIIVAQHIVEVYAEKSVARNYVPAPHIRIKWAANF